MHILIAEDNNVNQKLFRIILERLDPTITIAVAWDGGEALDYLSNPSPACPRPDIILMDTSMPVKGGFEVVEILRTQQPYITDMQLSSTPIVALTAQIMTESTVKFHFAKGFDDVLWKPARKVDLHRVLMYWSTHGRRAVPRHGVLQTPMTGGRVPIRSGRAQWGLGLRWRQYNGPTSLL